MPVLAGTPAPLVTETATGPDGHTITVTSDSDLARIVIDVTGGVEGDPLYVLRRDRNGTTLVRQTSAGTVLWVAGTPTTAPSVYDYEARQGLETDYILTDVDGAPLVSVRVAIPEWGAWIKSPGKPHMNVRVGWKGDRDYTRAARRWRGDVRGARYPVVLNDVRSAPVGQVRLQTRDQETARALTSLLADGDVLMIDVPDSYGTPVRYVSVGDVTGSRLSEDAWGDIRVWTLDVDEVAAPVGLPAGQGFTYEGLAALADSYIGLAAIFATYDDMALGLQT